MTNEKAEALGLMRAILPGYLKKMFPDMAAVEEAAKIQGYLDVPEVHRILARGVPADEIEDDRFSAEAVAAAIHVLGGEDSDEDIIMVDAPEEEEGEGGVEGDEEGDEELEELEEEGEEDDGH